ncbi:HAUS augmin-like complex subunit 3 [Anomaloglossus baeobatrachus]
MAVPPPTLSRQQSASFLQEPQRVQGLDFVEMLCRIGFPGAQDLKGADFDWLCEISEEVERFLSWLCEVVDQRNSLSSDQLEAFDALVDSGEPILKDDELQDLFKGEDIGNVEWEKAEVNTLEEMEAEVQSLRSVKAHRIQTRNKIESLGMTLSQKRISLNQSEKELQRSLNISKEELGNLNSSFNSSLAKLVELINEVGQCHSAQYPGTTFLSAADIEGYIGLEEMCWENVEDVFRGVLPDKSENNETQNAALEGLNKESNRVRTSWASQRIKLSLALGSLHGNMEAMTWLQGRFRDQVLDPLNLPLLEREMQSLETAVQILETQKLPLLVCEASLGLCLPAHNGWLQAEGQRIFQVGRSQHLVADALLSQLSRFQLVELSLQGEMQLHIKTGEDLGDLKTAMGKKASKLVKRLQRDQRIMFPLPRPLRIDSKDHTAVRLSMMLFNPSVQKELFPKYEVLQQQVLSLVQEMVSLSMSFLEPLPQTAGLAHYCDELHNSLCRGTRNLQLRDPDLVFAFETLTTSVSQFNQWFLDFFHELEHKKQTIKTSYLEQGRQLYVFFYQDPALLASIVQDLEQRVRYLR